MFTASGLFASLSLRAKLLSVNLVVVAAALTSMMLMEAGSERKEAERLLLDDTRTQAQIVGEAAGAALVFNDRRGAEEILRAMRLSPHVREATLFVSDRSRLASFHRPGGIPLPPVEGLGEAGEYRFGDAILDVSLPIRLDNEVVGYVLLRVDLETVEARLRAAAVASGGGAVLALVVAYLLSQHLREVVAGPILRLAQVTREISAQGDYSRRAVIEGKDEVATLARDFNSMIEQIERRNLALIHELEQRRKAEARLDHLAHFDPLTGLPNRRHFHNRIEAAVNLSARFDEKVSLMFIDLDNFKYVNDTLGHDVGDELLRHVARTLHATLRANDIICRLGGDEFAVIIDGVVDDQLLAGVATKLIAALARPILLGEQSVQVGCSIGIARCPIDCADAETLLRAADAAMYDAKGSGKNTFRFFRQQLQERTERRLCLESALREAVATGIGIHLVFQPVWSIGAECIVAVEALCRWQHPEQGAVPPDEFIPIAEESELIVRLGAQVLTNACVQGAGWKNSGHPLVVAVNVSGRQLRDPGFFDSVCRILKETAFPPELLEIELTESVLMDGFSDLSKAFERLRHLGVRIALDDFGTGYSSLSYLKRLPIDKLKIDRSFVRDLPHDAEDRSIARAIVALGRSLNLHVQAEGVENSRQLDYLAELGCEYIQGYLVARPLSAEDLTLFLARAENRLDLACGGSLGILQPPVRFPLAAP